MWPRRWSPMRNGRIVLLSDYIGGEGPGSGGAGHAALDSYRALRAAGADVHVMAGFGEPPAIEPERFRGLGGADLRGGAPAPCCAPSTTLTPEQCCLAKWRGLIPTPH